MEPVLALKKRTQRPQRAAPKSGNPTSASRNARRPSPTSIMPTFGELSVDRVLPPEPPHPARLRRLEMLQQPDVRCSGTCADDDMRLIWRKRHSSDFGGCGDWKRDACATRGSSRGSRWSTPIGHRRRAGCRTVATRHVKTETRRRRILRVLASTRPRARRGACRRVASAQSTGRSATNRSLRRPEPHRPAERSARRRVGS